MKNLTKLFLMVAALFTFACTTDVTEDLRVDLGLGGDEVTLTISLEESRTQLGEKVGELYPLTWSAGDKISVNGVESAEAASVAMTRQRQLLPLPHLLRTALPIRQRLWTRFSLPRSSST